MATRPLTAADRMPEVGDRVGALGREWGLEVIRVQDAPPCFWVRGVVPGQPICTKPPAFSVVVYVSRADGGPVTVDEG
jgi:hypothetical protein